jgi:hypothetical protein
VTEGQQADATASADAWLKERMVITKVAPLIGVRVHCRCSFYFLSGEIERVMLTGIVRMPGDRITTQSGRRATFPDARRMDELG